ncbi:hypothetical protein QQS21_012260 [Conoideocrella luteorostrata]|uniref:Cation-transporting P-type ATPase N-terminal domain-containing protein n=1 Tax=Conoideocrella luteorostrata TaxID=1105319 RepID=A0AAJ0CG17_9HYPO|nr:hypothetical protein QQS21_012260 [Conoideocrella luteorostrata]
MSLEKGADSRAADRVRWRDEEEGRGRRRSGSRSGLHRSNSTDSLAIRSIHGRATVDPSITLPIQYRTVSFQIEESKGKERAELARASEVAAKGKHNCWVAVALTVDLLFNNVARIADLSDLEWHTITPTEVTERLVTSHTVGLSDPQAKRRLQEYGRNAPSPPKTNRFLTIFGYFFKGFGGILLVGSILVFVSWKPLGEPNPAIANLVGREKIKLLLFLMAAFTMFQDWSTSRVMSSIKDMLPEHCQVMRDGEVAHLAAEELVPGDVVLIKAGNKLPADLRFIEVSPDVKFDRSVLTGESRPIAATVDFTDVNYLETHNIGLQGTHCIIGSATGIVVATADRTVFGRIATLTNEPKTKMTTLEREVLYFVIFICAIMFTMILAVVIIWAAWLRRDYPNWINVPTLIVDCVSVAVAFIPEGLPIAITAGLTITANLMRKNKILCKSLKTVETLGSVSMICSDKTGTLTQGKMAVSDCSIGSNNLTLDELHGKTSSASTEKAEVAQTFGQLASLSALCNGAEMDAAQADIPIEKRNIFGDATDTAVLRFSEIVAQGNVNYFRSCWQKIFELAFNSKNKFMIRCFTIARHEALERTLTNQDAKDFKDSDVLLTIKGAPDVLVERCSHYLTPSGEIVELTKEAKATFEHVKDMYSSQGKRCLLLARKLLKGGKLEGDNPDYEKSATEEAKAGLTLVGFVAIVDPLRPEIPEVVSTLRGAGIRFSMVTGDFALTALSIAREAGIVTCVHVDNASHLERSLADLASTYEDTDSEKQTTPPKRGALVISGPELTTLTDHQWATLTEYEEVVFARTTPEQKLRIVREYQKNSVVAMTGDGVNDAPSLKAADVGISMGSGSDIAMEAADMVLLDSFSSVVVAVQYGRVVFDNLKKVIAYLLPAGSFSEFWPVMTSVIFGLPQILSSFLMIIICCFTDCAAATVLSYEKPEADVLLRRPRNVKKDRLVNWQLIFHAYAIIGVTETLASFAMSFWYLQRNGIPFSDLWFSFGNIPSSIDPDYYNAKLSEASSIYFVNLVVMQWFNLMATRTRRLSIFQHPPLFNKETSNWFLFPAILFALGMAVIWLYIPSIQTVLGTSGVPVEHWFLPFTFGLFIILIDELRRASVRRWPDGFLAKAAW